MNKLDLQKKSSKIAHKVIVFFSILLIITSTIFYKYGEYQIKEAKLSAQYTLESSIRKLEILINRYKENSDLFKNMISLGYEIDDEKFSKLAEAMLENKDVVEAYELAPDGIVKQIYPFEPNKKAYNLNMLEDPERKTEATIAKETGNYTIAGPFELKQGGTGVLIFDPIYKNSDLKQFWGFALTVINWEKFIEELQIDKLEASGYHYNIYKDEGEKVAMVSCNHSLKEPLSVSFDAVNNNWYFEIEPVQGWLPSYLKLIYALVTIAISLFGSLWYLQYCQRQIKEWNYIIKIEEANRKEKKASEAKTMFLFNMSHDIRTPMNAIVGYTTLLEKHIDDKSLAKEYLNKIKLANSFLLSIINDTLEMARIESGTITLKEEQTNLKELFDSFKVISEKAIQEKNLKVTWTLNIRDYNVICDSTKLKEIILNIINNAIKYTNENGKIWVSVEQKENKDTDTSHYVFKVKDTGIGISKEFLPHIFEEFTREHNSTESRVYGVGLGLPIVKSLVEKMHGTIFVESELEKGSTFTVDLCFPLCLDRKEENREKEIEDSILFNKQVLLVEDNELNSEIAYEILKGFGLKVDCVKNGKECIDLLNKEKEGYYDAILMDIQMPVMNGQEATERIRKGNKNKNIPIIAMTANAFEEDKKEALNNGFNAYVSKPIAIHELKTELKKLMI